MTLNRRPKNDLVLKNVNRKKPHLIFIRPIFEPSHDAADVISNSKTFCLVTVSNVLLIIFGLQNK